MYCVIQEIVLRKPNKHGLPKKLEVYTYSFNGKTKYCYRESTEKFERPINTSYKISIHGRKRINGVVTKKQKEVATVDYYDLMDLCISDYLSDNKLNAIATYFNTTYDNLLDIICDKIDPWISIIIDEFEQTEEYKVHRRHEKIIDKYEKVKSKFADEYDVDESEYDYCYNVFGELMNKDYLNNIVSSHKKRSYKKKSYSNYNSYSNNNYDKYSRCPKTSSGNYTY